MSKRLHSLKIQLIMSPYLMHAPTLCGRLKLQCHSILSLNRDFAFDFTE